MMRGAEGLSSERAQRKRLSLPKTPKLVYSTTPVIVTLASDPVEVWTHGEFIGKGQFRTRRCSYDSRCRQCWRGWIKARDKGIANWNEVETAVQRFYFLCFVDGVEHWMEVGARVMRKIAEFADEAPGLKLQIRKSGPEAQAHVIVDYKGMAAVQARDANPFIDAFCLAPEVLTEGQISGLINGDLSIEDAKKAAKGQKRSNGHTNGHYAGVRG